MKKTTKKRFNDMLEVLPPAAQSNLGSYSAFLVGEPSTHVDGVPVYAAYITNGEEYITGGDMSCVALYNLMRDEEALADLFANADEPDEDSEDARILEAIAEHDEDIVAAFADCFGWDYVTADAITNAYSGQYDSDEDFAQQMAEDCGQVLDNVQWPYTCIDWERAARDLMYDYCKSGGYYFSNY